MVQLLALAGVVVRFKDRFGRNIRSLMRLIDQKLQERFLGMFALYSERSNCGEAYYKYSLINR